jgi:hypothetical protein
MKNIIVVKKGGGIEMLAVKNFSFETLYKKCRFRSNNGFNKQHTWKHNNGFISLFARDHGRAGTENKYDMPPPVDAALFFGTMALVYHTNEKTNDNEVLDLEKDEWQLCYNNLFGGFEELGGEDSDEETEEEIPEEHQTEQGYSKEDGFIVDDNEPLLIGESKESDEEEWKEGAEETNSNQSDDDDDDDEDAVYGHDSTDGEHDDDDEDDDDDDDDDEDDEDDDEEDGDGSELDEEEYSYK